MATRADAEQTQDQDLEEREDERELLPEERDDERLEDAESQDEDAEDDGDDETDDGEDQPRYTRKQLQDQIKRAQAAVQSSKDRRIAALEQQIAAAEAAEPVPSFESPEAELAWYRGQRERRAQVRRTEAAIAADLAQLSVDLSDELGGSIDVRRDDPRLDTSSPGAFKASLRAIKAEEQAKALRKQLKGGGKNGQGEQRPRRADRDRFDGGRGTGRASYDPKRYQNSGDVFEALDAKDRAAGVPRRGFSG